MKRVSTILKVIILLTLIRGAVNGQSVQLSNLPTIYINTGGAPIDSKDIYVAGSMTVVGPENLAGKYNGAIEIRGRGNSTWRLDKKPYRIKLASKYSLLGLPATEKNWVLLANHADKTLMRNALAFEVSKFLGFEYSCPYQYVDVVLNNEYIGNYLLTDNIEVAAKRVPIVEQKAADISEPEVTGGYLLEADGMADGEPSYFITNRGMKFTIKSPDDDKIVTAQKNYISSYFQMIEYRLFSDDFTNSSTGYLQYFDQASLVNWYIACEVIGNSDAFWSTYMYKKRDDPKIYLGPLWDFDIAFNNDSRLGDATFRRMSNDAHEPKVWIKRMLEDPKFRKAVSTRWKQIKAENLKNALDGWITDFASQLNLSQQQNFVRWPVLNTKVYEEQKTSGTYQEHVEFLRDFVSQRMDWLDLQMTGEFDLEKYYKIVNRVTSKALGENNEGTLAAQRSYVDNNHAHQWGLTTETIDDVIYYKIYNRASEKRLQSPGNAISDRLQLTDNANSQAQQWEIQPSSESNFFQIVNRVNGQAVDNAGGSANELNAIVQYPISNNNVNQQWAFVAVDNNSPPLPIYISGFMATMQKDKIVLSWDVQQSKGGSYFEVQRLTENNLAKVETIGTVPLRENPAGNYTFNDIHPLPGINYYRLKQLDKDHSFTYSSIIAIENPSIGQITLWPLPAIDEMNISFFSPLNGEGVMEIYQMNGAVLKTKPLFINKGLNTFSTDIHSLSMGLYFVKIHFAESEKILKMLKTH